jgi:hypothetical protein
MPQPSYRRRPTYLRKPPFGLLTLINGYFIKIKGDFMLETLAGLVRFAARIAIAVCTGLAIFAVALVALLIVAGLASLFLDWLYPQASTVASFLPGCAAFVVVLFSGFEQAAKRGFF